MNKNHIENIKGKLKSNTFLTAKKLKFSPTNHLQQLQLYKIHLSLEICYKSKCYIFRYFYKSKCYITRQPSLS